MENNAIQTYFTPSMILNTYLSLLMCFLLNVQLVELNGNARMKLSQDIEKVTIPKKKDAYRLHREGGGGGTVTKQFAGPP